jgi:hypothetical protein
VGYEEIGKRTLQDHHADALVGLKFPAKPVEFRRQNFIKKIDRRVDWPKAKYAFTCDLKILPACCRDSDSGHRRKREPANADVSSTSRSQLSRMMRPFRGPQKKRCDTCCVAAKLVRSGGVVCARQAGRLEFSCGQLGPLGSASRRIAEVNSWSFG